LVANEIIISDHVRVHKLLVRNVVIHGSVLFKFLIAERLIIVLRKLSVIWGNWRDNFSCYAVGPPSYIADGLIGQTLHVLLKFRSRRVNSSWASTFLAFYAYGWRTCHFHYIFYFILFFILFLLLIIQIFVFFILLNIFSFFCLNTFAFFKWQICVLLDNFLLISVYFIWVLLQMKS